MFQTAVALAAATATASLAIGCKYVHTVWPSQPNVFGARCIYGHSVDTISRDEWTFEQPVDARARPVYHFEHDINYFVNENICSNDCSAFGNRPTNARVCVCVGANQLSRGTAIHISQHAKSVSVFVDSDFHYFHHLARSCVAEHLLLLWINTR